MVAWVGPARAGLDPGGGFGGMGEEGGVGEVPGQARDGAGYSSVVMMARRVSMPSPFSEEVTTSSG